MESATRWTLGRVALVVGSLLPIAYLTISTGLAWLGFGPTPYFVIPMALGGIASIFWPNRWLMLVPGIFGTLSAVGDLAAFLGGQRGDPGVFRPDRTAEYGYWWLSTTVGLGLLALGILWVVRTRKGGSPPGTSRTVVALVVLVVALWLGGVAAAVELKTYVPTAEGAVVGIKADKEATLTAITDKWDITTISGAPGGIVKLTVTNKDAGAHVFDQSDAGLKVELAPGATKTVWLRLPAVPGSYQYYCELHSSKGADGKWAGMVGTITVA